MPTAPWSRRAEIYAIFALTFLGAGLRLWSADRLGLSHFDEGIYARWGFWAFTPDGLAGTDPGVIAYAPPGLPALIGISYLILGPFDLSAIAVSLACGVATIPVVGWLGRRTFGPGAGALAALFAALSGPHVVYARMALTDVPFLLSWLLALAFGQRFLERPGVRRAIVFGVVVGLAQNFKYNGWLAGAIVALSAVIGLRRYRESSLRALGFGTIAAMAAALVYWPWFVFVENHGGYARLLAHHRTYLGGWASWWPNFRLQMAQAVALSGGENATVALWIPIWVACLVGLTRSARTPRNVPTLVILAIVAGLGFLAFYFETANLSWWLALAWTPFLLNDERPATRMLGTWWIVMAILTPFYHPYARLWLPILAAGWLLTSGLLVRLAWSAVSDPGAGILCKVPRSLACAIGFSVGVGGLVTFGTEMQGRPFPRLLQPTDGLRRLVDAEFAPSTKSRKSPRVLSFAPPALLFYLEGRAPVQRTTGPMEAIPSPLSGDWGLIDEALIPKKSVRQHLRRRLPEDALFPVELPPAYLLDVEPDSAFGRRPEHPRAIWILKSTASPR